MKEKQLTTNVSEALKTLGCAVYRLDQPRRTMQTPGLSDLYVVHPDKGLYLWIELKVDRNTPTDYQEQFIESVVEAGGQAGVAWSLEEALYLVSHYAPEFRLEQDPTTLSDRFKRWNPHV